MALLTHSEGVFWLLQRCINGCLFFNSYSSISCFTSFATILPSIRLLIYDLSKSEGKQEKKKDSQRSTTNFQYILNSNYNQFQHGIYFLFNL